MSNKIKTFEDALKALKRTFEAPKGASNDEIAYMKLKIIAEALNKGWQPNWHDWNQWKYYPWFKMGDKNSSPGSGFSFDGCGRDFAYSCVGSRLCFKTSELAEYAGKQFIDLYKEFLLIEK